jgi:GMP synthase (glutamine-hydrolysing)
VRRRGWGTATTPFNHVASDRATAGEERGSKPGSERIRGTLALPWAGPRMWGERREYSQCASGRSIRSSCQWRWGKPYPGNLARVSAPVVAVLHNLADAFTGHAGDALRAAGVELREFHLRDGEALPDLDGIDGVLSLGGEQSVLDIDSDPMLTAEAAFLREAVEREIPVLGVCLGAQLLAHALGGHVLRLPRQVIRWVPIEPLPAAAGDPVVGSLPEGAVALHWNEDGFEPPPGSVELLRRPGPTGEAFRFGHSTWGVQFHPEVHDEGLDGWYEAGYAELSAAGVTEEEARAADARHLPAQRELSDALFGGFAKVVAARTVAGESAGADSLASSLREHRVA